MAPADLVYLDASAFVKLVRPEPETAGLVAALQSAAHVVAAEILEVEVLRANRRAGGDPAVARTQLEAVGLVPLTAQIRAAAGELDPPTIRSLDAIHLATALSLHERLTALYTYDARMADAARGIGLSVCAPG